MKIDCSIIEDLMPLYAENICSAASRTLVEDHCAKCESCRGKLEAQNIPLPEKKIKGGAKDPLKKTRLHYIRLAAVTAIICAVLTVPVWKVFVRTASELTMEHNHSWSNLKMENQMKKFAKLFMKGDHKAALDTVGFTYSTGMSNIPYRFGDGGERLRADYAAMLADFTAKYPIESYVLSADAVGSRFGGHIQFYLDTDYTAGIEAEIYMRFTFVDDQLYLIDCVLDPCFSTTDTDPINAQKLDIFMEIIDSEFGMLRFYGDRAVNELASMAENGAYDSACDIIVTAEYLRLMSEEFESVLENNKTPNTGPSEEIEVQISDYRAGFAKKTKALFFENYTLRNIYGDDPYFSREPSRKGSIFEEQGSFKRDIHINMDTKDGTPFWVSFTCESSWQIIAPFENITYSDNAPEEFKKDFEDIFCAGIS